jgi:hypothetical protein
MGGGMLGGQLPTFDMGKIATMFDNMKTNPDIYAGAAVSVSYINLGINAESVFGFFNKDLGKSMKNIYFNVKGGASNTDIAVDSKTTLNMKSSTFGLGVNYQLFPATPSVMSGLFMWRGLNVGTGFNFQSNKIAFTLTLDKITQEMSGGSFTVGSATVSPTTTFSVTPKVKVGVDSYTCSIPLEAMTSVQFLWLSNINFGLGADLVFGSTDINAIVDSDITIDSFSAGATMTGVTYTTKPGSVSIDASTKGVAPSLVRARIMTGFGTNLGPVKIDVPIYYYLASGFAIGLSAGFVW